MSGYRAALEQHQALMSGLIETLSVYFEPAVSMLESTVLSGGKILTCGNGGSQAHAAHMAGELLVRYLTDRRAIPAIALGADACTLTAHANDYGYAGVFKRQVEALGKPGDVLIAFSTSGKSQSVLEAVLTARVKGLSTLGFSGARGLSVKPDVDLAVPSLNTARIQEAHTFLIHVLTEELERRLPK